MLIIEIRSGESIDQALKRYKRKHQKVGLRKELQERKYFVKPSVKRRNEILKAIYVEQRFGE